MNKVKLSTKENSFEFNLDKLENSNIINLGKGRYHLIYKNKTYNFELISYDATEKIIIAKVNGKEIKYTLTNQLQLQLEKMGFTSKSKVDISKINAPMPGLVIEILIKKNQEVKKGDSLLVLEAMKMENILKSPTDGIIKSINVAKGTAVEKEHLLITFK